MTVDYTEIFTPETISAIVHANSNTYFNANIITVSDIDKLMDGEFIFLSFLNGSLEKDKISVIIIENNIKLFKWSEYDIIYWYYRNTFGIHLIVHILSKEEFI